MSMNAPSKRAPPQSFALAFSSSAANMADVVVEQLAEQKAVPNGEVDDKEEADPVDEAAKKKKKKKKKKGATTGKSDPCQVPANRPGRVALALTITRKLTETTIKIKVSKRQHSEMQWYFITKCKAVL